MSLVCRVPPLSSDMTIMRCFASCCSCTPHARILFLYLRHVRHRGCCLDFCLPLSFLLFPPPASSRQLGYLMSTHLQLAHLKPGTCFQPNVRVGKLIDRFNPTRKNLNTFTTNCKQSGMGEPFWDFCQGDFE